MTENIKTKKILTISVAAYNVEKYLKQLCDSVICANRMDDIELLIIDDGSKDNTSKIAKHFENLYPGSIQYVYKKNGGHGSTINKGIELATGKYFKVLDGDDWMDSQGLKKLIDVMKTVDCDTIITDRMSYYEDSGKTVIDKTSGIQPNAVYEIEQICPSLGRLFFHSIYFKTSILKEQHIHIDEHCFYVDNEILWYPFPFINTIYYFNNTVYCYRLGLADQSVNVAVIGKRKGQHEFVCKKMVEFYCKVNNHLSNNKQVYLRKVIDEIISWHFDVLLLIPFSFNTWREVRNFRKYTLKKLPDGGKYCTSLSSKLLLISPLFYPIAWIRKGKDRKKK